MRETQRIPIIGLILIAVLIQACGGRAEQALQPTVLSAVIRTPVQTQPTKEVTSAPKPETTLSTEAEPVEEISTGLDDLDFDSFLE
jgi:hypothetical protein